MCDLYVGILIAILNLAFTLYCSWMCRICNNALNDNSEYFELVKERMDYYNLTAIPTLIKYMEDLEKYEEAAKLKKVLDESKQRLKI